MLIKCSGKDAPLSMKGPTEDALPEVPVTPKTYCAWIARTQAENHPPHLTPAQFLLAHGIEMGAHGKQARLGTPRACFYNAYRLAVRRKNLRYAEGFAHAMIPCEHAWCVDREGRVVDPTWGDKYPPLYFGVMFELDLVRQVRKMTPDSYSVLWTWWKWHEVFPVLNARFTQPR